MTGQRRVSKQREAKSQLGGTRPPLGGGQPPARVECSVRRTLPRPACQHKSAAGVARHTKPHQTRSVRHRQEGRNQRTLLSKQRASLLEVRQTVAQAAARPAQHGRPEAAPRPTSAPPCTSRQGNNRFRRHTSPHCRLHPGEETNTRKVAHDSTGQRGGGGVRPAASTQRALKRRQRALKRRQRPGRARHEGVEAASKAERANKQKGRHQRQVQRR